MQRVLINNSWVLFVTSFIIIPGCQGWIYSILFLSVSDRACMLSMPVPSWRNWLIRADRCSQHKHKDTAIDDYMCQAHKYL